MDQFPCDLLRSVYEFLPWRERLATRRLSSKFRSLLSSPARIHVLTIHQDKNTVSFILKQRKRAREPTEVIEIVKATQKTDFVFSKTFSWENARWVQRMTVHCTRPNYHRLIDVYMNFFVSACSCKLLELTNLSDNLLATFRKTFHRIHPDFDWMKEQRSVRLDTLHNTITREERHFMNFCKAPHYFAFAPAAGFRIPDDFWQLGALGGKKIFMNVGGNTRTFCEKDESDFDLGVDDEFVDRLIKRGMVKFQTNSVTTVTPTWLINYIESCLNGGHIMFCLLLFHKFDQLQLEEIRDLLLFQGFVRGCANVYIAPIKRDTKEGYEPDELRVVVRPKWIKIIGDIAEYRGKISLLDLNHYLYE